MLGNKRQSHYYVAFQAGAFPLGDFRRPFPEHHAVPVIFLPLFRQRNVHFTRIQVMDAFQVLHRVADIAPVAVYRLRPKGSQFRLGLAKLEDSREQVVGKVQSYLSRDSFPLDFGFFLGLLQ